MKKILSREEVERLWHNSNSDGTLCSQLMSFSAALESALLEKLCGEPVGFVEQFDLDQLKQDQVSRIFPTKETDADIPLYALNRGKA